MKETNAFGSYEISTDPDRLDRAQIHRWLSTDTYWALGRSRGKQDAAIDGSLNFGAYAKEGGAMAAYARVVTDLATFAWLCDVYVAPAARGGGLGTALVAAVRDHLAPYGVNRVALATRDAHGVYGKAGFTPLEDPREWMTLDPRRPGPAGAAGPEATRPNGTD
ncbi:GNAT family N-acetyltransferase [Streptomyces somaliensis DSM 40738]|uniref:GNAT family N-acetyltransferase n=1 Tax=Streptomyces somaliensis (strain ATCC 33201 / DSM 40738 / JCM 12659 / KCTC 9044 / NCTC 11332 / NRRL B-12077 / IP 733) TaxID=1134445 RepID=A0AA44DBG9_STRE0|nr:GNAT family N-acetyltransferase [Streptomyces somaliensis]MCQ0022034.1 GNAT family N-acetyltransferase [Streptomyces somaliensis DSM 40738]NKY13325.1 GNAT family N-acetyltransferase [Streptomyces somaliensis DSM 40738]